MAAKRTEAHEAGQLALFVEKDLVYNALSERVAKIITPLYDSGFDFDVCHLHPNGRIEDGSRKFLGYWSEGKVYNHEHKMVGQTTGAQALPAAAALLAIRHAQALAGQDTQAQGALMRRPPLKRPDHKLQTIIAHPNVDQRPTPREPEPDTYPPIVPPNPSEPMDPWVSLVLWLALAGIVITAVIVALLFVAVTSPIWAGMMIFAVVALRMLIWTHSESLDYDWPMFAKTFRVRSQVYFMALTWGAFSATVLTLISRDLATAAMCAGAIIVGLLFIRRFLDRWGAKQLFRRQERAEGESKPWVVSTAAFIRERSTIVVASAGGLFAVSVLLSATVFAKRPTYGVVSVIETSPPSVIATNPGNPLVDQPGAADSGTVQSEPTAVVAKPGSQEKGEPERVGLPSKTANLASLSMFELDCLRNEPYARRGYKFKRPDLTEFFAKQSWYKPTTSDQGHLWDQMSHEERDLILRIKNEQAKRSH